MSNLPMGAEYRNDAPWNQLDSKPIKVKVKIDITYVLEVDLRLDEGYDKETLKRSVYSQILFPNGLHYLNTGEVSKWERTKLKIKKI